MNSKAEYRVFQLRIFKVPSAQSAAQETTKGSTPADTKPAESEKQSAGLSFRDELSTLDPEQYRGYHPVGPDEVVKYVATWRCYGRTNGRDLCPNPKLAEQNPTQPKWALW